MLGPEEGKKEKEFFLNLKNKKRTREGGLGDVVIGEPFRQLSGGPLERGGGPGGQVGEVEEAEKKINALY